MPSRSGCSIVMKRSVSSIFAALAWTSSESGSWRPKYPSAPGMERKTRPTCGSFSVKANESPSASARAAVSQ